MINQQEILIKVKSDVDQATKQIGTLTKEVDKLSKNNKRTSSDVNALSSSFNKLGGSIAAVVAGFGAVSAIKGAISTIADFESSIIQLGAVSGASEEQLRQMSDSARDMGANTQYSATEAANAMNFLAMAGFDTNEILKATPSVLDLATVGNLDLARASDIASDSLTAFGLEAEDMEKIVDVFAKTITTSNTNVEQLGSAFAKVAPVASALGITVEETSASLGILADAGIKAELAGTQLKIILNRIATDKKAQETLKELGIAAYDSEGNFKGLTKILEELSPKLAEMNDEAKANTLKDIAGSEAIAAFTNLTSNVDGLVSKTKELNKATGTAGDIAEKRAQSLANLWKTVNSALEELTLEMGEVLLPVLKDATRDMIEFIRSIDKDDIEGFAEGIKTLVKALGFLVDIIGLSGKGYAQIAQNIELLLQDGTELNEMLLAQSEALGDVYSKNEELLKQGKATQSDIEARRVAIQNLVKEMSEELLRLSEKKSAEEDARVSTQATTTAMETLRESIEVLKTQYADLNNVTIIANEDTKKLTANTKELTNSTSDLTDKTKEQEEAEKTLSEQRKKQAEEEKKQFEDLKKAQLDYWQARLQNINTVLNTQIAAERQLSSELKAFENERTTAIAQRTQNQITSSNTIMSLYKDEVLDYSAQNKIKDEISRLGREAREAVARGEYEDAQKLYSAQAKIIEEYGQKKEIVFFKEKSLVDEASVLLEQNRVAQNQLSEEQIAAAETNIANKEEELTGIQKQIQETENLKTKVQDLITQIKNSKAEFSIDTEQAIIDLDDVYKKTEIPMKSELNVETTKALNEINVLRARAEEPTENTHIVKPNTKAVDIELARIQRDTFSTHTIDVYQRLNFSSGGLAQKYASGGMVSPLVNYLASGGFPRRNGQIPGHDTTGRDDVPSMLTQGEYVHRVAAVDYYGRDFMEAINRLQFPKISNFADGGNVGGGKTVNVNLTMPDGNTSFSLQTDEQIASSLERYIRKHR